MTASERERMILSLRPNVIGVVNRIFVSLPPGIDREDMISEAWIGAIAAVESFEAARGLKLSTFAEFKIRGRVLDFLRRSDPLTRNERRKIKSGQSAPVIQAALGLEIEDGRAGAAIGDIERRTDVRLCLHRAQLTRKQVFVLKRRYWDFALDREIAAELGVHVSAIAQTHTRAIRRLRRLAENSQQGETR